MYYIAQNFGNENFGRPQLICQSFIHKKFLS